MSQISSSSTNPSPSARKLCRCGGYIKTWTSWTDLNLGRRFEACEMSRKQRKWASLGVAGRTDLCKRKRTNSWVVRRMRAMEADLKLIEEQKKEVEDKLKMVEREKKELEYEVGELGKQKIVGREKNRPTTKRESDLGGFISIIRSWVFGDYDDALCLEQLVDIFGWKL
ncbi:unnamed protein product [Prunus armeniaca]|uniref:Uncharacterized protein n=1 Tax=Prunus armeniaca TaxID=36596 RepID=A0A6J5W4M7_PRUAR|nr:unnamed protein product [Prunus armeniaca]